MSKVLHLIPIKGLKLILKPGVKFLRSGLMEIEKKAFSRGLRRPKDVQIKWNDVNLLRVPRQKAIAAFILEGFKHLQGYNILHHVRVIRNKDIRNHPGPIPTGIVPIFGLSLKTLSESIMGDYLKSYLKFLSPKYKEIIEAFTNSTLECEGEFIGKIRRTDAKSEEIEWQRRNIALEPLIKLLRKEVEKLQHSLIYGESIVFPKKVQWNLP